MRNNFEKVSLSTSKMTPNEKKFRKGVIGDEENDPKREKNLKRCHCHQEK